MLITTSVQPYYVLSIPHSRCVLLAHSDSIRLETMNSQHIGRDSFPDFLMLCCVATIDAPSKWRPLLHVLYYVLPMLQPRRRRSSGTAFMIFTHLLEAKECCPWAAAVSYMHYARCKLVSNIWRCLKTGTPKNCEANAYGIILVVYGLFFKGWKSRNCYFITFLPALHWISLGKQFLMIRRSW